MSKYSQALDACTRYVDPSGKATCDNPTERIEGSPSTRQLIDFYKTMVLIRQFDNKAVALQRTGQMGTYPSCLGQEAFSTGIGYAMRDDDVFIAYYRDQATQYLRGVTLSQMFQLWGGDERANDFKGVAQFDLPVCVPIATQVTHAAGVATAIKVRGEHRAALVTCGDGATSRGDFYESLNVAGVWHLPLVVVVNNNQWAISVPGELQTAAKSIAVKAEAAGLPSERVDGNDVLAVYDACNRALKRARAGKGATLIECVSYRLCDHTTADDASRYRHADELKEAWSYEPISRMRTFLNDRDLWTAELEQQWQADVEKQVEEAARAYLNTPPQKPDDLFDYLYETLPPALEWQKQAMIERASKYHTAGAAQEDHA
jgi:pyruvate dehydrogenase E1 component alpha subunit